VQLVTDDEVEPRIPEGSQLRDVEGPGAARANVAAYRQRFAQMTADMAAHCRAHGMPYVQLRSSMSFDRMLDGLIQSAVIAGRR
jgi:hypothetical protein